MINKDILEKSRTIAIYGNLGSGKTALAFKIIDLFKDSGKQVFIYRYPKPELIERLGYKSFFDWGKLEQIQNSIIYIDEPQLYLSICDKKTNEIIAKFCSLARQRDNILIISSCDTRVFTKHNESYFDLWLVKQLDINMVKQRSLVKDIINLNSTISGLGFSCSVNEFLAYSNAQELCGRHTFEMPDFFTEEYSKSYNLKFSDKLSDKLGDKLGEQLSDKLGEQLGEQLSANSAQNNSFFLNSATNSATNSAREVSLDISKVKDSPNKVKIEVENG